VSNAKRSLLFQIVVGLVISVASLCSPKVCIIGVAETNPVRMTKGIRERDIAVANYICLGSSNFFPNLWGGKYRSDSLPILSQDRRQSKIFLDFARLHRFKPDTGMMFGAEFTQIEFALSALKQRTIPINLDVLSGRFSVVRKLEWTLEDHLEGGFIADFFRFIKVRKSQPNPRPLLQSHLILSRFSGLVHGAGHPVGISDYAPDLFVCMLAAFNHEPYLKTGSGGIKDRPERYQHAGEDKCFVVNGSLLPALPKIHALALVLACFGFIFGALIGVSGAMAALYFPPATTLKFVVVEVGFWLLASTCAIAFFAVLTSGVH